MLICYVDESGNTGSRLDDPHQPLHLIAAVMVREDRVRDMADRLDELAKRAPTREPLIEYHASELFHGSGSWEGVYPRQRISEYAKALAVLGQVEADVAYASINKPMLAKKGYTDPNPHTFALQFLAEKVERFLRLQTDVLSQRVLLVADENHEQEQYAFDLVHAMQSTGGPIGADHGLNITLDHFVDAVYFDRSDRNRGIQLADLVAYILHRRVRTSRHPSNPRSDAAVRQLVNEHLDKQIRTWREPWP